MGSSLLRFDAEEGVSVHFNLSWRGAVRSASCVLAFEASKATRPLLAVGAGGSAGARSLGAPKRESNLAR